MTTFQGIPAGAFEFYAELEDNNNREWWLEHKDSYNALVRDPVTALRKERTDSSCHFAATIRSSITKRCCMTCRAGGSTGRSLAGV